MSDREGLKQLLRDYVPADERERADREAMLAFLECSPDPLTRENTLFHFTASAWAVNPRRDRALMVFHHIYRAWSWVGGHADGDADLAAVARRELTEETGVKAPRPLGEGPLSLELLAVQPHEKNGVYVPAHLHLNVTFLFCCDETEPLRVKPDENSGVAWREMDEILADRTEPHMNEIYRKLARRAAYFR